LQLNFPDLTVFEKLILVNLTCILPSIIYQFDVNFIVYISLKLDRSYKHIVTHYLNKIYNESVYYLIILSPFFVICELYIYID